MHFVGVGVCWGVSLTPGREVLLGGVSDSWLGELPGGGVSDSWSGASLLDFLFCPYLRLGRLGQGRG